MRTPTDDIDDFVRESGIAANHLDISLIFARSMLRELCDTAGQWHAVVCELEERKAARDNLN
jgi:hypothetical protein